MKRSQLSMILLGAFLVGLGATTLPAEDETVGIYFANYSPAAELAKSVMEILGDDAANGIMIEAEPTTNSLLVRGEPEVASKIHELLKQLDRKPATVFVEAVIVDIQAKQRPEMIAVDAGGASADQVIEAMAKQGDLQILARVQLSTISNQAAFIQLGERKPKVSGVRTSSQGVTRTVELENVGLTLGLTPRVTPEGTVMIETDLERSDLAPREQGVELSSQGDRAVAVNTLSIQTTVCVQNGQTVVLGGRTQGSEDKWQKTVALLTAKIVE